MHNLHYNCNFVCITKRNSTRACLYGRDGDKDRSSWTPAANEIALPVGLMEAAAGHLPLGGGGMDHGAAADADTGMVHLITGIALKEHQITGFEIAHGADQRPASVLRIALGVAAADAVSALLHAIIHQTGAVEGAGPFRTPYLGLAQLILSRSDDAGIGLFAAGGGCLRGRGFGRWV